MLNDTPNVMTELAPKGPRFVEIIEIMDRPDIPFIKYFNDKTVVFNNQIITGLLLLRTHGCKHCQTRGFTV